MRLNPSSDVQSLAVGVCVFVLATVCWFSASGAVAGKTQAREPLPPLPQQKSTAESQPSRHFAAPVLRRARRTRPNGWLGQADEIATLYAIHTALSSVGDGGAYVWQRGNGLLDGLIRPTTSFKSSSGEICRHVVIRLNSKRYSREVEGIACRDESGAWSLSG